MKKSQIAAQIYTIRAFCKTQDEFARSLAKLKKIGYEVVEVSGVPPVEPKEVARLCANEGLSICAILEDSDLIRQNPEKIVENLNGYGVHRACYPYPKGVDFGDLGSVDSLIDDLGKSAQFLASAGCKLFYHNHGVEFCRIDGETVLERISRKVDPSLLGIEMDTYWVQYGGGDPADWCEFLKGRLALLHMKDYLFTTENKPQFAEIGKGNLNFPQIISAAEKSGTEWFIVEQDTCPGDPFESLKLSFDYLRDHICS